MPFIRVLLSGERQRELADRYDVVATYPAFAVLSVTDREAAELTEGALAGGALVEDVSDQYEIPLGGRVGTTVDTARPRTPATRTAGPDRPADDELTPGPHHYLVQFVGPVKPEWTAAVGAAGGEVVDTRAGYTVVVRADEDAIARIGGLAEVRWVGHLPTQARIAVEAADEAPLPRTRRLPGVLVVEFFTPREAAAARAEVEALGARVLSDDSTAGVLVVEEPGGTAEQAEERRSELAAVHGVRMIRRRAVNRISNDVAAGVMRADADALGGSVDGFDGEGEVIGICDTGFDTGTTTPVHPDFAGRVRHVRSYPVTADFAPFVTNPGADDGAADLDSGHGTHVAGSVLGDGTASAGLAGAGRIRGLAHRAELVFQAVEQALSWRDPADLEQLGRFLLAGIPTDLTTLFVDALEQGVRVHSNSWGGGDPGAYDTQARQLDQVVWDHPELCVVVAAGNDGTDSDGDGRINPGSVTSPGTAKNCITVGASENLRPAFDAEKYGTWWPQDYPVAPYRAAPMADDADDMVAFSSRGPTTDGRVKPDVVAPGTWILSTKSTMLSPTATGWKPFPGSKRYFYMGGTSMATPLTAGAVAVVRQYLRRELGVEEPTAALLKAALVAGAARLPDVGEKGALLDPNQGYGRVDVAAVVRPGGGARLSLPEVEALDTGEAGTVEVEVTDGAPLRVVLAYSDFPGAALVNNLNLVVTGPDGRTWTGNSAEPGGTFDRANNVELVQVAEPETGTWTVQVVAANVPRGPQPYALVVLGATTG